MYDDEFELTFDPVSYTHLRIAAELYSYQGRMSVFVDDLRGSTVEIGADEEFETASTIKAFILAVLYLQASRGKADLEEAITYEASQFVDGSGTVSYTHLWSTGKRHTFFREERQFIRKSRKF